MSGSERDTAPIRQGEELDLERIARYLRDHLPQDCFPDSGRIGAGLEVEQFPGGHSNLTYLLRFGPREFVLRRPPVGPVAPTAHDMVREFRVLSFVHPWFGLAPRPLHLCEDTAVLGVPFYVMERRRGTVIRRELPAALAEDVGLRRRVSMTMIETLARLHSVDIFTSGVHQIGKPDGFLDRQIRGWSERWEKARTEDVPEMSALSDWLRRHLPAGSRPTLVHNDFKLDNVMLDPDDPTRVVAVLDWEMCTVGDPLVDLGLLLCYWPEPGDPEDRRESISPVTTHPGWMTRKELAERYGALTGRDTSFIAYYEIFALFKLAVVVQQIYFRFHRGQTRDSRFASFGRRAAGLIRIAAKLAGESDTPA